MQLLHHEIELNDTWHGFTYEHMDQFLGGWHMNHQRFLGHLNLLRGMDIKLHAKNAEKTEVKIRQQGDTLTSEHFAALGDRQLGLVSIRGPMTKYPSSLNAEGATTLVRRRVRQMGADQEIDGIVLIVDSPGGTVAGTKELADDVYRVSQNKPVLTYFEDMGASAAYYVGSQGNYVYANEAGLIGSIGTILIVSDFSEMMDKMGVKVHVVSTGEFKGAGAYGTEVTDKDLAYFQNLISEGNKLFIRDAARGREMQVEEMQALADGRVHLAADAADLGLIDGVATLEDSIGVFIEEGFSNSRGVSMAGTTRLGAAPPVQQVAANQPQNPQEVAHSPHVQAEIVDNEVQAPTAYVPQQAPQQQAPPQQAAPQQAPPQQAAPQQAPQQATPHQATPQPTFPQKIPATLEQIKASCPGCSSEFIVHQLEAKASLEEARQAFMLDLVQQNTQLNQQLQMGAAAAPLQMPGNQPVIEEEAAPLQGVSPVNVEAVWREKIAQAMQQGMDSEQATVHVDKENPGLRDMYLEHYKANPAAGSMHEHMLRAGYR